MKKLIWVFVLLLTTSTAFADGPGLPPTVPPGSSGPAVVTNNSSTSSSASFWSSLRAWLSSVL
jgi:hypothetical protein